MRHILVKNKIPLKMCIFTLTSHWRSEDPLATWPISLLPVALLWLGTAVLHISFEHCIFSRKKIYCSGLIFSLIGTIRSEIVVDDHLRRRLCCRHCRRRRLCFRRRRRRRRRCKQRFVFGGQLVFIVFQSSADFSFALFTFAEKNYRKFFLLSPAKSGGQPRRKQNARHSVFRCCWKC